MHYSAETITEPRDESKLSPETWPHECPFFPCPQGCDDEDAETVYPAVQS